MKNTKPRVWPNRALEVDVEYELRTSAPKRRWNVTTEKEGGIYPQK